MMWERNEKDFSLTFKDDGSLSIGIGTWSNYDQSFADCMFYLEPRDEILRKGVIEKLEQYYADDFKEHKKAMISSLKKHKLNFNSVVSANMLEELADPEEGEEFNGIDEDKLAKFVDGYTNEAVKILVHNKTIGSAYKEFLVLKNKIRDDVMDDMYSFWRR